jgi:chemotaxis protein CheD
LRGTQICSFTLKIYSNHSGKRSSVRGLKNSMSLANDSYYDRRLDSLVLRISPCEYAVSGDRLVMVTGLGSCVAVCLIDPTTGVCGMNHFMLPSVMAAPDVCDSQSARYGAHAMELLINRCMQLGARRSALVAKIYGGASVLSTQSDIGQNNYQFATAYLRRESIPVVSRDVGGTSARKITFKVPTGEVNVEFMNSLSTIVAAENQKRRALNSAPNPSCARSIELFAGDLE